MHIFPTVGFLTGMSAPLSSKAVISQAWTNSWVKFTHTYSDSSVLHCAGVFFLRFHCSASMPSCFLHRVGGRSFFQFLRWWSYAGTATLWLHLFVCLSLVLCSCRLLQTRSPNSGCLSLDISGIIVIRQADCLRTVVNHSLYGDVLICEFTNQNIGLKVYKTNKCALAKYIFCKFGT